MLYQLSLYAVQQGLSSAPGYSRKKVRAIVAVSDSGAFTGAELLADNAMMDGCPTLSQAELIAGGKSRSHFLVDSMATVCGMGDNDGKALTKRDAFAELHHHAAQSVAALLPISRLLGNAEQMCIMTEDLVRLKVKPTDNITFRFVGQNDCILECSDWRDWWQQYREMLLPPSAGDQMRCLMTGELVQPASIHPKLKLARVGGQSTGSVLAGFDKLAFESFELEQSRNAACSAEAAAVYAGALNDLVEHAPPPLANTLLLHWLDKHVPPEDDPFGLFSNLSGGEEEAQKVSAMQAARHLAEAVRKGDRPELIHNRYHVILLCGAAGRAMVRSTFEGELTKLIRNACQWFEDMDVVVPRGQVASDPPKLFVLLTRVLIYRPTASFKDMRDEMDDQLAPLTAHIWESILQGSPFPQQAAAKALVNLKSRLLHSREYNRTYGLENLDRICVAMLKLWYNRALRHGLLKESGGATVGFKLDHEHPAPTYHAGRLLAVLNHLQHSALGNVNADVAQRFFFAMSVTPGLVIGRLLDGAQSHLAKLRKEPVTTSHYVWYQQQIAQIMSKFGDEVLRQQNFASQTLFALGYYHQSAALFERHNHQLETKEE